MCTGKNVEAAHFLVASATVSTQVPRLLTENLQYEVC